MFPVTAGTNCTVPVVLTMAACFGVREMERVGAATVSAIDVVGLRLPDVPVMLTAVVPIAAVPSATRVRMLVMVVLGGLKDAVTPDGKPEADRMTVPAKAFLPTTVIVLVILPP
jgi:hypothetical protein